MEKVKLLDCTLRDGGYYTNWDFSDEITGQYFESMNKLPIEYLEVGYRSKELEGYYGRFFYCPVYLLEEIRSKSTKKIAIILNEKDTSPDNVQFLLEPIIGLVDLIRVAVDPDNFVRALKLAEKIRSMGFDIAFNVMYMSSWIEKKEMLQEVVHVTGLVDYFYMVDSFGGIYPSEVKAIYDMVKEKSDVKVGFHGHNNLELGLINTLTAIECGVDIVDATITGMGRGAGNLKMELLLTALNSKNELEFDYNDLMKVVDPFTELQDQYQWGTNMPYMVSGANSLPQKEVMEWVGKRYYSFNSIIRALNNQSQGREDNTQLPELDFANEKNGTAALIVGGGSSPKKHEEAIRHFLNKNPEIIVIHASSKNALCFSDIQNEQYYCLVGNEGHRLEDVFKGQSVSGKCVLPPFPRRMGTYIPKALENKSFELQDISFTDEFKNSHTSIALQTAMELGVRDLYLVGYDAYEGNISQKEQELFNENMSLFKSFKSKTKLDLVSLNSTGYKQLTSRSLYALI